MTRRKKKREELQGDERAEVAKTSCKEMRRQQKRLQKSIRSQQREGECVFHALLAGVIGARARDPSSHKEVLGMVKNFARHKILTDIWVSSPFSHERLLSVEELSACRDAVLNSHIGDGYLCAAEDPLLILTALTFQINIVHDYVGNKFEFVVSNPKRTIYLESSMQHMEHIATIDHIQP